MQCCKNALIITCPCFPVRPLEWSYIKLQTNHWCLDNAPWVLLKIHLEITLKLFYITPMELGASLESWEGPWRISSMKRLAVHLTLCLYWLCHSNEEMASAPSHRAARRWRLLTLSFHLTACWVPLWITYDLTRLTLSCSLLFTECRFTHAGQRFAPNRGSLTPICPQDPCGL